jgi:Protein of unknown function (DUF3040)
MEVDVPLSEHEQRLLEQIERSLVDEDPKFASAVRSGSRRSKARRRFQLGVVLVPIGLAGMVGGVATSLVLGIIGALVMFAGGALIVLNYKHGTGSAPEAAAGTGPRPAGRRGSGPKAAKMRKQPLKNRLEERFRRRYDQ